jgi:hypothetical protein
MKQLDKKTKAGFKWSTGHDGILIYYCNYAFTSNFGLDFRCFHVLLDKILYCNWTFLTQKEIQSENGVEQENKICLKLIT